MKITKEYLSKYIFLEKEINRLRKKRKRISESLQLSEHGVVKGSVPSFPFTEAHFIISGVKVKPDKEKQILKSQLLVDIKANEELYESMKLEIEKFIESVEDLEIKQILEMKYIQGMKDEEIGDSIGYSRRAIGMKIDSFMGKLDKSTLPQLPF